MRIGVVFWEPDSGIVTETTHILRELGHDVSLLAWNSVIPDQLDVIFMSGPFGSIVPLGKQLAAFSAENRPKFVWLITEQLPNPNLPRIVAKSAGMVRSHFERWSFHKTDSGWHQRPGTQRLTRTAHRFRYLGDMVWLQNRGVLSLIVTGSPWRAQYMRQFGIEPFVTPSPAYYPRWGARLNLERDIPVLWIGKPATKRRRRALERLHVELEQRGIEMQMIDGEHHPYVFGDDRTRLINRTRIMVNILRTPWDNHAMRYGLAALNGAMIVGEPAYPHTGFVPGEHLIETPLASMAETISTYLDNEPERKAFADRAYAKICENSRETTLRLILNHLEEPTTG